jgi:hypothetical protein
MGLREVVWVVGKGGLMGVFDRIKSVLGSKPVIAPPEHRLSASTEAGLDLAMAGVMWI